MQPVILLLALTAMETSMLASDRTLAEWVLRMGGSVNVNDVRRPVWKVAELPDTDFRLTAINLVPVTVDPPEFQRLAGASHLKELYVSGRTWHSMPAKVSRETFKIFGSLTSLERLVLSLPV